MKRTIKEQLRILVDEHERGLLPTPDYRRLRRGLLERAATGENDAPDEPSRTQPREAKREAKFAKPPRQTDSTDSIELTSPKAKARPDPDDPLAAIEQQSKSSTQSPKNRRGLFLLFGLLATVLVGFGYWSMTNKNNTEDKVSETLVSAQAEVQRAQAVIAGFIQSQDWAPGSLRRFGRDWEDISTQARLDAKNSSSYRELARELRDRLNDSELSDANQPSATTQALNQLAAVLGLQVESRFAGVQTTLEEQLAEKEKARKIASAKSRAAIIPLEPTDTENQAAESLPPIDTKSSGEMESAEKEASTEIVSKNNEEVGSVIDTAPGSDELPPVDARSTLSEDQSNETTNDAKEAAGQVIASNSSDAPEPSKPLFENSEPVAIEEQPATAQTPQKQNPSPSTADPVEKKATPADQATTTVTLPSGKKTARCHSSLLTKRRKYCRDVFSDGSAAPKLAIVRTGSFKMGSDKRAEEKPLHTVTISRHFAVGAYEVSFAEYEKYCKSENVTCPDNPWGDEQLPVVNVNWHEAVAYTQWLSEQTGASYRLPSEAEWEYATRAGTDTDFPFGDDISFLQARFSDSKRRDRPVITNGPLIIANDLGLKHAVGNASEWVADVWRNNYEGAGDSQSSFAQAGTSTRVVRGGSYLDRESDLRSSARSFMDAEEKNNSLGFRIVRDFSEGNE